MKMMKKVTAILLVVLTLCSLAGCVFSGSQRLLNGHRWGETENQTAAKGWKRATFAGFKIGGNKHAYPVFTRHSDAGLYEVDYSLVVVGKDEKAVYSRLRRTLGRPAETSEYFGDKKYVWYKDRNTVCIEVTLDYAKRDFENAKGEETVTVSVGIVNDRYK